MCKTCLYVAGSASSALVAEMIGDLTLNLKLAGSRRRPLAVVHTGDHQKYSQRRRRRPQNGQHPEVRVSPRIL